MDDDFEFQLKQEELERKKLSGNVENIEVSASEGTSGYTAGSATYTDPSDGTVFEWDFEKKAWFPKIDADFIATYQANYGSHQLDLSQPSLPQPEQMQGDTAPKNSDGKIASLTLEQQKELSKQKKREKRKLAAEKSKNTTWFDIDEDHNTNVYVSGLPLDFTDSQFEELMSKYGVIAKNLGEKNHKLKLYRDADGNPKGDGRCCYIKRESVDLALSILDGSLVGSNNNRISVERAKFELKGEFDPSKKRKKLTAKAKKQLKEQEERLFSWKPEKLRGERPKSDATVVLKNVFTVEELTDNPVRLFDLREEINRECLKYGIVRKIVICDNNADGVVTVSFKEPEEADDCVTMMNYRIFSGRQLKASKWDGKTKFQVKEKAEDQEKRLSQWEQFLVSGEPATSSTDVKLKLAPADSETTTASSSDAGQNEKHADEGGALV